MATIEAHDLQGKDVVDVGNGQRIGSVADLLVDSRESRITGLVVSSGVRLSGDQRDEVIPAEAVHAVGRDAITVDRTMTQPIEPPAKENGTGTVARSSGIKGRRIVTTGGREVGRIDDLLIDSESGSVAGYTVTAGFLAGVVGRRDDGADYIAADPTIRFGEDVVVVPDEAVVTRTRHEGRVDDVSIRWTAGSYGRRTM
jgi:sporulation protein YlmC with PRC-barrel domain